MTTLPQYLAKSARDYPENIAIYEPGHGEINYRDLDLLSEQLACKLRDFGVKPGDRVGLFVRKSIDTVAAVLGVLKTGAAYVPVDSFGPSERAAYILDDCAVVLAIVEARLEPALRAQLSKLGRAVPLWVLPEVGAGLGLQALLDLQATGSALAPVATPPVDATSLAYILYTSGSTGRPKGVMLTHANAVSFVEWASELLQPYTTDRFSSHAPFHFDLSILDLYVPIRAAAAIVLVAEDIGKDPLALSRLLSDSGITIWYSTPTILNMLAQSHQLSKHDYSRLRAVLFAGEVFAVQHLRALTLQLPRPRYLNLYGPTETNVCTYFEATLPIPEDRSDPLPIGTVCENLCARITDVDGNEVPQGEVGELTIGGPNVMRGYWNRPELTEAAFQVGPAGTRYYRTGDLVRQLTDGTLVFRGRRDRMVKKHGYRVELGEIEACLYRHPEVIEAAVVSVPDPVHGLKIRAHLKLRSVVSKLRLKEFCSRHVPVYMIPDSFVFHEILPKTSTDKIDYQAIVALG